MMLVCSLLFLWTAQAAQVTWIADSIQYSSRLLSSSSTAARLAVNFTANGLLFEQDSSIGHFKLQLALTQGSSTLSATTGCLSASASSSEIKAALEGSEIYKTALLGFGLNVQHYFTVRNQKLTKVNQITSITHLITMTKRKTMTVAGITVISTGCQKARTYASWHDPTRWTGQAVPGTSDTVTFPANSGVVEISSDVAVSSLTMSDASIIGHATQCPDDWTASMHGNKCYKLIETALSFADAENYCNTQLGSGSFDRHLVHIKDRVELGEVYGLCRGSSTSIAKKDGCWIGLYDKDGDSSFQWLFAEAVGGNDSPLFLDWRRFEPSNSTVSYGSESYGGERCATTFPGQEDPLLLEQGGWVDNSCQYRRPFICQSFAQTKRFSVRVSGALALSGGSLLGGHLSLAGSTIGQINNFTLSKTASLSIRQASSSLVSIGRLYVDDGSTVTIASPIQLASESYIGEATNPAASLTTNAQSKVTVLSNGSIAIDCATLCTAKVNARVDCRGAITVRNNAHLELYQGGELSRAKVALVAAGSQLVIDGYASRLSTYDAFDLSTTNRGAYQGEYRGTNSTSELSATLQGVYRIKVTDSLLVSESTQCIAYSSSAADLAVALNALALVQARGGAVVRRYGDHSSSAYKYGYTYRIELNQVVTNMFPTGSVQLSVDCYGISCGCAETLVPIEDESGTPACLTTQSFSVTNTMLCNVPATFSVSRISTLSYASTSGAGSIVLRSGTHRLPPVAAVTISVSGTATGIVAANTMNWYGLQARDVGQLIITGLAWSGWDIAELLYAPEWTDRRGFDLSDAPSCTFASTHFYLDGLGSILSAAPNASLVWQEGSWQGGIIGGMARLQITKQLLMGGTGKSLKYGITMTVAPAAEAIWSAGNISLANGATVIVQGNLSIANVPSSSPMTIGEARFLESITDPAVLIREEPGRSWQSYFSVDLAAALRSGWYVNPLCDERCNATNLLIITGAGILQVAPASAARFLLPAEFIGTSQLRIGTAANVTLSSGGTCGNNVVVDLSERTTLTLDGGQMEMQATCTIQGSGELLVVAGLHDLAFSIDAHITIAGGTLLWPESRGVQQTITFNGGLLLQGTGILEVQPFSTTIIVKNTVELTGDCLIQFPLIGIAAQASAFDASDAPDTSPRGNFTATGVMSWQGGTLKGKADFNILTELNLDGGKKYIQSLAKLVNQGHCEWGDGDLILSDNGDFQNFGTVQMRNGVADFSSNAYYKGTALPVENGGDVFALEFHSYDSDLGALNTEEYLRLTALLVSKVPNGWTPEDQS